jgi:hypothetical protein
MVNPVTTVTGYNADGLYFLNEAVTVNLINATLPGIGVASNTSDGAIVNVNTIGINTFGLSFGAQDYNASAVVNLGHDSAWIGSFDGSRGGTLTVNGGAHTAFVNTGTSEAAGAWVTLNTVLAGTGSISLDRVRGATGTLTANKAVGPGQTVVFGAGNDSRLTLNAPKAFAGTVNLAGAG